VCFYVYLVIYLVSSPTYDSDHAKCLFSLGFLTFTGFNTVY